MSIIALTEDNISDYDSFIDKDMAENMGRVFYRGLMSLDGGVPKAAVIWEYKNLESDEDTESIIRLFKMEDKDAAVDVLREYTKQVKKEQTKRSFVSIPVKEGKAAKEVLKEAGFNLRLTESDEIIVTVEELLNMPFMQQKKGPKEVVPLSDVTPRSFRKGISFCASNGKKGLCEDLEELPMDFFEENVSVCFERDGEINSFLLFHKLPSGMLSIQFMLSMDKELQLVLISMIIKSVLAMEEEFSLDTKVLFDRHNQASLMLSEKLLPRGFGVPVYAGSREE